MTLLKAFTALIASAGLLLQPVIAHSVQRNPISYLSKIEDAVIQTPAGRIHAHSSFEVTFLLHNKKQKVRLKLEPNHDIISHDATIQIVGADGTLRRVEPIDRSAHKIYRGDAFIKHDSQSEWTNAGWARLMVHMDGTKPLFEGAFRLDGDHHHVQTSTNYRKTALPEDPPIEDSREEYMVVWRDSDITPTPDWDSHGDLKRDLGTTAGCTSDELLYNRDENNLVYRSVEVQEDTTAWALSPRMLFGRQSGDSPGANGAGVNLGNSIGSTAGCPTTRKVALVGIATDCTYTADFNSTEAMRANIIQQVNSASQLYESSFNISLGIQNLTLSEAQCPSTPPAGAPWNLGCSSSTSITDRLNLFSTWRGQWKDNNAYWTLLTKCGTGNAVGLAWLGQVCQTGTLSSRNETIAGANVVVRTASEWLVFAHETGHTFGAVHDCTTGSCADGSASRQQCCPLSRNSCNAGSQFIMNPSTGSGITNFSPCSIGNICSFLGRYSNQVQCLANNRDVVTITGQQCGNGIVEQGEDCDCGGEQGCGDNPCCNPKTCKFNDNAVCDPSNEECCTGQCQFASQGSVCRASTGVCDPEETCSGTSSECPADVTSPDGTECGESGNGLQCASGQCTSRNQQCRTMFGRSNSNDTNSCSDSGCMLTCSTPSIEQGRCVIIQQYFLDGTPCEGGGKCQMGNCAGASLGNQIGEFFEKNKDIIIPVGCAVGGLILLSVACCCFSSCRRRRRAGRIPKSMASGWGNNGGYGPMGMTPANLAGGRGVMPPPYPGHGGQQMQNQSQDGQRWEPMRTRSFRYA